MKVGRILAAVGLAMALLLPSALAATRYEEGLIPVESDRHWGFANCAGTTVISPQYVAVEPFHLGTAQVTSYRGVGLVRPDGIELIAPEYDSLENIGYGLHIAQLGHTWGILSQIPFDTATKGEYTQLFCPFLYDSIQLETTGGLSVLALTHNGEKTLISMSSIGGLLASYRVPSAQFPLTTNADPKFRDVAGSDWFDLWVDIAYNVGLMAGNGDGTFAPNATLSVAEALKLAAFMESRAAGDDFHLQPTTGSPWYRTCLTYCIASGIITATTFDDYERPITRGEMAQLFANTALGRNLPTINNLTRVKNTVPDVNVWDANADSIYHLYATGILSGSDSVLTFRPDDSLTRAEAAAIASRMARAEQRVVLWSLPSLPGYQ